MTRSPDAPPPAGGRLRLGVAGLAVLAAIAALTAALVVDGRLDRQWGLRGAMFVLALVSVAVLLRLRTSTRVIGVAGILLWGVLAPVVTTTSATTDETDFALAVADAARTASQRGGGSILGVQHVEAAVVARGGAVGPRPGDPGPQDGVEPGKGGFTVLARPEPERSRPRVCLHYFDYGFKVKIRRC